MCLNICKDVGLTDHRKKEEERQIRIRRGFPQTEFSFGKINIITKLTSAQAKKSLRLAKKMVGAGVAKKQDTSTQADEVKS